MAGGLAVSGSAVVRSFYRPVRKAFVGNGSLAIGATAIFKAVDEFGEQRKAEEDQLLFWVA